VALDDSQRYGALFLFSARRFKMDILWTIQDVAREFSVSGDAVRHWEKKGQIEAVRTKNGVRLFYESEVRRFQAQRAADREAAHGSK
jgi:hypothetical protein